MSAAGLCCFHAIADISVRGLRTVRQEFPDVSLVSACDDPRDFDPSFANASIGTLDANIDGNVGLLLRHDLVLILV